MHQTHRSAWSLPVRPSSFILSVRHPPILSPFRQSLEAEIKLRRLNDGYKVVTAFGSPNTGKSKSDLNKMRILSVLIRVIDAFLNLVLGTDFNTDEETVLQGKGTCIYQTDAVR